MLWPNDLAVDRIGGQLRRSRKVFRRTRWGAGLDNFEHVPDDTRTAALGRFRPPLLEIFGDLELPKLLPLNAVILGGF